MKHLHRPILLAAGGLAIVTPLAQAHPGHDTFSNGVSHAVTSGNHLAVLAALGGVLFAVGFAAKKTGVRRSLQCLGLVLAVGAAAWSAVA